VLLLILAWWARRGGEEGRILLPFLQHLMLHPKWVFDWRPHHAATAASNPNNPRQSLIPAHARWITAAMLALAGASMAISSMRLIQLVWCDNSQFVARFSLAHGRDIYALICIWLLFGCVSLVGYLRVSVATRRYMIYRHFYLTGLVHGRSDMSWRIPAWGISLLLAGVFVGYWYSIKPVSVDSGVPWMLSAGILAVGIGFLMALAWQVRQLTRFTTWLAGCIALVNRRPDFKEWPSPDAIRERPQTPFNLHLRRFRDVSALSLRSPRRWARLAASLVVDGGVDRWHDLSVSANDFEAWQQQLIAEMRLVVVALRTSTWCVMLAPLAVLLAMAVYPPVFERLLTSVSVMVLLVAFFWMIYAVLRLEKDPMLGAMFTREGESLSFGGALRALWPKIVAIGVLLLPLVAPDAWGWLHTIIRSVNSAG